jgi:hypothetical protein
MTEFTQSEQELAQWLFFTKLKAQHPDIWNEYKEESWTDTVIDQYKRDAWLLTARRLQEKYDTFVDSVLEEFYKNGWCETVDEKGNKQEEIHLTTREFHTMRGILRSHFCKDGGI